MGGGVLHGVCRGNPYYRDSLRTLGIPDPES